MKTLESHCDMLWVDCTLKGVLIPEAGYFHSLGQGKPRVAVKSAINRYRPRAMWPRPWMWGTQLLVCHVWPMWTILFLTSLRTAYVRNLNKKIQAKIIARLENQHDFNIFLYCAHWTISRTHVYTRSFVYSKRKDTSTFLIFVITLSCNAAITLSRGGPDLSYREDESPLQNNEKRERKKKKYSHGPRYLRLAGILLIKYTISYVPLLVRKTGRW